MHAIAKELNAQLEGTVVMDLLSDFGKRIYFPRGIISQSMEAKEKAYRLTATVGIAMKGTEPLYLPSIYRDFSGVSPSEVFPYASTAGDAKLRSVWKQEMIRKNPDLEGADISSPMVCSGLTHGICITGDMFLDPGDVILVPDMFWGNYRLIFEERRQAALTTFRFYTPEKDGMDIQALDDAIAKTPGPKAAVIFNFPNNPSGYSPTEEEAEQLVQMLVSHAQKGKKLLVIMDDAYFGLFYEPGTCTQSLFAPLANIHENILAVKVDGATKEELVWGFRIGFLTFGCKGMTAPQYDALQKKAMGTLRSSVSNSSRPAQSLLLKGLESKTYHQEKQAAFDLLKERYDKVKEILSRYRDDVNLIPLPFNSGYFMSFACRGDAEKLRVYLLDHYGVGTIAIGSDFLRIAFSSVDLEQLEELYTLIYQAAGELWN